MRTDCWQRSLPRWSPGRSGRRYDLLRRAAAKAPVHEAAVTAAEWGLRGVRKAEETAESTRLAVADVVAEARERVGEEVPPPAVADANHDHDH